MVRKTINKKKRGGRIFYFRIINGPMMSTGVASSALTPSSQVAVMMKFALPKPKMNLDLTCSLEAGCRMGIVLVVCFPSRTKSPSRPMVQTRLVAFASPVL